MSYRIAGIDVHKRMLAVVVSDVEVDGEFQFEQRMFGSSPDQLRSLAEWLLEQEVEEAAMESTAQYWKPVWETLERYWKPLRQKREGASRIADRIRLHRLCSSSAVQPSAERQNSEMKNTVVILNLIGLEADLKRIC